MNLRQEKLLNILIDQYIRTAEPISSKFLVKSRLFDLSSATLRNEMHGLEEAGYLAQLHTSGGRIPTDKAYRFYVDNLIESDDFEIYPNWQKKVDAALSGINDTPRDINRTIAQLLSDLTENVVIAGIADESDFYKTGLASLLESPEFREIDKIFKLTSFFDEFDRIFSDIEMEFFAGIDRSPRMISQVINVFIGEENPVSSIREETVLTARYMLPDNFTGTLTIIGPTRMDYKKNIGLVRYTTEKINQITKNI